MDFIKKALNSNKSGGQQPVHNNQGAPGAPAGQKDDYGDKAFAFAAKKSGHNVDKNTQEKITDGMRGFYEKATGKKVDPKYSN